jgi:hypothetical protein
MYDHGFQLRSAARRAGAGALALALVVLVLCLGCVASSTTPPVRAIIVAGPPPAPLVEERPPPTQPLAVWIAGYWHWTGIQYAWIPGHWEVAPPSGATWRAPRYVKTEGAYIYEPGIWWLAPGLPAVSPARTEGTAPRANAFH